jgi:hypothetical protein
MKISVVAMLETGDKKGIKAQGARGMELAQAPA